MNELSDNPDTLPTRRDPKGPCPRCGRVSNFICGTTDFLRRDSSGSMSHDVETLAVLQCHGCNQRTLVIESLEGGGGWHGVLWWPTPGLEHQQTPGVPQKVSDAYQEGIRFIAVRAPNAAVAMFRTVIAQIVEDKGSAAAKAEKDLYRRIEQMVTDRTLWEDFGDWAHHVRGTGNAGAHGEKYDPVTIEQATELQKFIGEIINFLYTQPARRAAAMPPTKATPQPAASQTGTPPGGGQA
ncbi:DUF4145 domain-containing protein [Mycobacteroides abscessus]|uniref:DUF4145 domain-containing protein n=1 Tax=Mycobacteroides abscessus TaxID=36809 RepID=UPI0009C6E71E|nr:DUF4145 domain-containing protein [Mycobacteroides abscessus]SKR36481.1 Uncharacterised protein [Mycobacteroides abscessus subsp. massiliense]